jgi:hypothetical protein
VLDLLQTPLDAEPELLVEKGDTDAIGCVRDGEAELLERRQEPA